MPYGKTYYSVLILGFNNSIVMELIAGFFAGLLFGLVLLHLVIKKRLNTLFEQRKMEYVSRISKAEKEIYFRQSHLNQYRFSDHNLNEVLAIQPQITII